MKNINLLKGPGLGTLQIHEYFCIGNTLVLHDSVQRTTRSRKKATEGAKVENLATTPDDIKKEAADLAGTTLVYTEEQKELYKKISRKKWRNTTKNSWNLKQNWS